MIAAEARLISLAATGLNESGTLGDCDLTGVVELADRIEQQLIEIADEVNLGEPDELGSAACPGQPQATTQPTAQGGSAPPRRDGAVVQAACNDCARLEAQKFPWPASFWEPRGPQGKTVQRYARCLAAQAVSAPPTLISEPDMVSVT
jgi:hypothetical protein